MASGLAKSMAAGRLGCRVGELRSRGLEVVSAGIWAMDGARATPEAVLAARELGADIARHRSRPLTAELIRSADVVFCMTPSHVSAAGRLSPGDADKVLLLDADGSIADPIGGGDGTYRATARQIADALARRMDEGWL
jgi:protein-tyrosine-phosphatase